MTVTKRPLPCMFLGPVTAMARCVCRRKDVRRCGRGRGKDGEVVPVADCEACPEYAADAGRADLFGDEPLELLPGFPDPLGAPPDPTRPADWHTHKDVRERHLEAFKSVLGLTPDPAKWVKEAGIVTCGGGPFYGPQVQTLVRTLRRVGCTLPVEVWYHGELEPVDERDYAGLDTEPVDALATAEMLGDRRLGPAPGWESKIYALTHTKFKTALFLDADVYAVADPTPLVAVAERHGFAFWHDLPSADRHIRWPVLWPAARKIRGRAHSVPPVQGGQLVFNRADPDAWRTLALTHYLCQHSEFTFKWMYGDQDAIRVALAAGGGRHHCLGPAEWRSPAFVCKINGTDALVHRCGAKLAAGGLPGAAVALYEFACAVNGVPWSQDHPCPTPPPAGAPAT